MNNDPGYFPSNIAPASEKERLQKAKETIDYAINKWRAYRAPARGYFSKMEDSYNGILDPKQKAAIDNLYGVQNRVEFVDFKITRNKLDTLLGEYLLRPIKSVVSIVNKEVSSEKQKRKNMLLGMFIMRDAIAKAQQEGMDVTGGIQVPESKEEALAAASYKTKAEVFFNRAAVQFFKVRKLQDLLYDCMRELAIKSECFMRTYINQHGEADFMFIAPEDAMFEEMKNDPFLKKSSYMGARIEMTRSELFNTFSFSAEEKKEIDQMFSGEMQSEFINTVAQMPNSSVIEVFHIEMKWLEMWTLMKEKDLKDGVSREKDIAHDDYVKNRSKYNSKNPRYERNINEKVKERKYEIYRIGGTIYKNFRKVPNTTETPSKPYHCDYSYKGLLFNTVGGVRVPFFALMEEAKFQYNLVRNAMNRELAKFKGVAFGYDRAVLPVDKNGTPVSANYIAWKILNDGVIDYSSAQEGNYGGKDVDINDMFKSQDYGITTSFMALIQIAHDLERLIDRLSSVNDNRQGLTSASETVTNAENNTMASRTITEPMMYFFDRFTENIILSGLDNTRVWSKLNPDSLEMFIGDEAQQFFSEDFDVSTYDLGVIVENTRVMQSIKARMQKYIETSLNAGELAIPDAFEVEIADTVAEAKSILRNSWTKIQALKQESQQSEQEANANAQNQALDTEIQFREDGQVHDKELVVLKGQTKGINDAQKNSAKKSEILLKK